jgi:tripartite-type tricarboxylate transporter receptor subunit TctC
MKARFRQMMNILLSWGCLLVLVPACSLAQEFPSRPVTINVGYGPGDNVDLQVRMLANRAQKILGQPVVVVNKPGAAGAVALTILAKEKPDGYQLGAVVDTPLDRLPLLRKLSYKAEDFVPVLQYASSSTGVVVKSSTPWRTLPDLIRHARENPGKVTYATTGAGTSMHVAFEYIAQQAEIQWTHVPYGGAKQGVAAVVAGHITAAVGSTQWAPEVREGSLRLLATLGEKRMKAFPDVPTIRELGYEFGSDAINLLVAPRGTPPPVLKRLHDAFRQAMDDPDYAQLLRNLYVEVSYRDGEEVKKYLAEVRRGFAKVIADLRIPTEFDGK